MDPCHFKVENEKFYFIYKLVYLCKIYINVYIKKETRMKYVSIKEGVNKKSS